MLILGWAGLEPATNALKGRCSTIELPTPGNQFYSALTPLATNPESLRGCSTIELPTRGNQFYSAPAPLATNPESLRGCSTIELPTGRVISFTPPEIVGNQR